MNEPCISFENDGKWSLVYKLSASGVYLRALEHYVCQAHKAIISACEISYDNKIAVAKAKAEQEAFKAQQHKFAKQGVKDDLPSE